MQCIVHKATGKVREWTVGRYINPRTTDKDFEIRDFKTLPENGDHYELLYTGDDIMVTSTPKPVYGEKEKILDLLGLTEADLAKLKTLNQTVIS